VIVVDPADTPVTTPELLIVATDVADETQGLTALGVPEPVNVVVLPPEHTVGVPEIVGKPFTVTVAVAIHPLLLVNVITLVPAPTPVTTPVILSIVATDGVADVHGVAEGVPVAFNGVVLPTHTLSVPLIEGRPLTVTVAVVVQLLLLV